MDHAEAQARILDAAGESGRLTALLAADDELRAHLASCATCAHEAAAWSATVEALAAAFDERNALIPGEAGVRGADDRAPMPSRSASPAPDLRARTLAFVADRGIDRGGASDARDRARPGREERVETRAAPRLRAVSESASPPPIAADGRRRGRTRRLGAIDARILAAAAVVVLAVASGGLIANANAERDSARSDASRLSWVVDSMTSVLAEPGHRSAILLGSTGQPAGIATWDPGASRLVVVASGLAYPPSGATYRCWVETSGVRTWVGRMEFATGEAYWVGPASWTVAIGAGTRFGVSLVGGPAPATTAPVVLTGTF